MNIVVDTSVIIAVIADEPEREQILRITRRVNLLAPLSVHWEVGNAFSAMLRRGRTTLEAALRGLELYQEIPIRFVAVELEEALRLSSELKLYAYDAYLIACARRQRAPLLTLDHGLQAQAKLLAGVTIMELER